VSDFESYGLDKIEANTVPKGEYPVVVVSMEKKPTKKPGGERLNVQLKIAGGPLMNRTLFDGLNVKNENAMCQNIGRAQLKNLCMAACGKAEGVGIQDIINATMKRAIIAVVDIKDDQNVIKKYKAREVAATTTTPAKNMVEQAFEPAAETTIAKPPGW